MLPAVAFVLRLENPSPGTSLGHRTTPAGQVIGLFALGELDRVVERGVEVLLDRLPLYSPAQEIGPQEFAERRRVLGEPANPAQFTGQRPEGIVDEILDRAWDVLVTPPSPPIIITSLWHCTRSG